MKHIVLSLQLHSYKKMFKWLSVLSVYAGRIQIIAFGKRNLQTVLEYFFSNQIRLLKSYKIGKCFYEFLDNYSILFRKYIIVLFWLFNKLNQPRLFFCITLFVKVEFQLIFKHCSHQLGEKGDITWVLQ